MAHAAGHPNAYGLQKGVTRVLALSPDIDLSRTRNWAELSSIIAGLVQVGLSVHAPQPYATLGHHIAARVLIVALVARPLHEACAPSA